MLTSIVWIILHHNMTKLKTLLDVVRHLSKIIDEDPTVNLIIDRVNDHLTHFITPEFEEAIKEELISKESCYCGTFAAEATPCMCSAALRRIKKVCPSGV